MKGNCQLIEYPALSDLVYRKFNWAIDDVISERVFLTNDSLTKNYSIKRNMRKTWVLIGRRFGIDGLN